MALIAGSALNNMSLREEVLLAMTKALEARDDETEAHARRVSMYAGHLAVRLGMDAYEIRFLRWGSLLHDIGKIGLPDAILHKPGPLTEEEMQVVKRHPQIGYDILRNLGFLGQAREIVLAHHEHWDGTGYPKGLQEEEIPLGARIFSVVDAFDAMTSDRPYRKAMSFKEAKKELSRVSGRQIEPKITHIFMNINDEELAILRQQAESSSNLPTKNKLLER